ncbi:MAG: 2-oxo acid dehydrogenase subunit E2 [Alphaproteobacteria bacterium]|nr:2-oxo acid dehydrogenase subunit E2 [Alphaproteobacteria bacterium]MBV9153017.1 2-oxo acid dehydrogenase subunit E2 [Alphaproteobacteria bacterium]
MGRYIVKLPDIGEGTTEAEIVKWHIAPGQEIREEDPLVDVMTDKATVEIPAPIAGTVVAIEGVVGEKRPVGSLLVTLDVGGAGNVAENAKGVAAPARAPAARRAELSKRPLTPTLSPPAGRGSRGEAAATKGSARSNAAPKANGEAAVIPLSRTGEEGAERNEAGEGVGDGDRSSLSRASLAHGAGEGLQGAAAASARVLGQKPLASPAVRRRAWDLGIELQFVPGSGPSGRITQEDLDAYAATGARPAGGTTALARRDGVEEVRIVGLRRAIAEHLQQSKRHIPHFSYVEEVDVTPLEELRAELNARHESRGHLTLLPFLVRAIVSAVVEHPQVNARYDDEAGILHRHNAVHMGIATQTDAGLLVPVLHHAEAFDVWQAAAEIAHLADIARAGKATREELTGSTITVTSLGALGGLAATPVVNYPEVAIVGVNRIAERPVVRDGQIAIRKMMNLSSSFDHRIVDGWEAASFIQRIKRDLEQPALLFVG